MAPNAIWNGNQIEGLALADATNHNCACKYDKSSGARTVTCDVHQSIVHDQRFLNGLVWMRRSVKQLLLEEFGLNGKLLPKILDKRQDSE